MRIGLLDLREHVQRRPVGQMMIQYHSIGLETTDGLHGLIHARSLLELQPVRLEVIAYPETDPGVIVDDEDTVTCHAAPPSPRCGAMTVRAVAGPLLSPHLRGEWWP